MAAYSLVDWLTCLRRELAMRRRVYPKFIAQGRMTQQDADHEIGCMQSLHDHLAAQLPPKEGTQGSLI